jgi:hypothetical protein
MLWSVGLTGAGRRRTSRLPSRRTVAWLLVLPSLPWVFDATSGFTGSIADLVAFSGVLLLISLVIWGLRVLIRL